ncbi:hypothetical protein DAE56_26900 [Salmonella enterica]|nr:hypothetical protein [Salmonella enterica]
MMGFVCCNMLYRTTYKYYKPNQATIKQATKRRCDIATPYQQERQTIPVLAPNFFGTTLHSHQQQEQEQEQKILPLMFA